MRHRSKDTTPAAREAQVERERAARSVRRAFGRFIERMNVLAPTFRRRPATANRRMRVLFAERDFDERVTRLRDAVSSNREFERVCNALER